MKVNKNLIPKALIKIFVESESLEQMKMLILLFWKVVTC